MMEKQVIEWIPVSERLPEPNQIVHVVVGGYYNNGKGATTMAQYIAPKTTDADDFLAEEWCSDPEMTEYDEEKDVYWVLEGWFEYTLEADMSYRLSRPVSHWHPRLALPSKNPVRDMDVPKIK
jgi:Protein of unknown function (DUF551)